MAKRPKRGMDHTWQLVKYKGDAAIYAKCKCGHRYYCSRDGYNENGERTPLIQVPKIFYPYCPICGARKKWYTNEIQKIDKYQFEE